MHLCEELNACTFVCCASLRSSLSWLQGGHDAADRRINAVVYAHSNQARAWTENYRRTSFVLPVQMCHSLLLVRVSLCL